MDGSNSEGGRNTPSSPSSQASTAVASENGITVVAIAAHGDIVLRIEHQIGKGKAVRSFRVDSRTLRSNSKYFESLLQPGRFGEAANIEARHKSICERYGNLAQAPAEELPIVDIEDLGRINVKTIDGLVSDFLYVLHGNDTHSHPPVANLANLAVVADRFDALKMVKDYVRRKKMIRALDGKTTPKQDAVLTEEKVRQRLLVGIMLDYPAWVDRYSARMITKGWVGAELEISTPLWWDLASRVEDELSFRRDSVLDTIQSLQAHFLRLYTSRDRQCKLGYDSSTQCDSFQLGEMVRFFTRIGTLQFQGTVFDVNDPPTPYAGDVFTLLDTLRQVPEYQIDKFHTHCGIRTRMLPLLDLIQAWLQCVGICLDCWQEHRADYAWIDAKPPLLWKRQNGRPRAEGHGNRHAGVRGLFTATEKDWT
ncbi:hypothetical protein LTR37_006057 [Vermiconidia calcicola]|uniref:Uncharacterized protein n=1 Tax=Vermiconidia calcicola TaxID=1690605 RepID=A0ACC3NHV8_9PEZI|nr:hypothetical protein LTR37_006057 [Vermiconidia calcicola]